MPRARTQPSLTRDSHRDSPGLSRNGGGTQRVVISLLLTSAMLLMMGPVTWGFQSHVESRTSPLTGDALLGDMSKSQDRVATKVVSGYGSACTSVRSDGLSNCGTNLPPLQSSTSLPIDTWWNETGREGSDHPPAEIWASMAQDPATHETILFGGLSGSHILNQTWTYQNGTWKNISALHHSAPSPVFGAGMTYDPTIKALLLYGGCLDVNCSESSNYLWEFSAGVWSLLLPSLSPPSLGWPSFSYDPANHEDLLMGGYECPPRVGVQCK